MSAPANFQPGSFRGAPFVTRQADGGGGRRGELHEFPGRDEPYWEDLGRRARRFTVACHTIGPSFDAQADALEAALDASGPGTLVHPWRGTMQVAVTDWRRLDSTDAGGMVDFSIDFVEAGALAPAPASIDTAAQASAAAYVQLAAAPARFADIFSIASLPGFVLDAAHSVIAAAANACAAEGALLGGSGVALRTFQLGLAVLPNDALLSAPANLGLAITGLVSSVAALGGPAPRRAQTMLRLARFGVDLTPIDAGTPARAAEAANQAAVVQLVTVSAAAELVRAIAATSFASYQDAVAARDTASDVLDLLSLRQADAGDDLGAGAFDTLRRAMVRDVTARGGNLARLRGYSGAHTEPALVLAMRLYRDPATVEPRAAEIVARNHLPHPSFVPGGVPLEVLSNDGASGG